MLARRGSDEIQERSLHPDRHRVGHAVAGRVAGAQVADKAFEPMRSVWEPDAVWTQFIANMLQRTPA